MQRRNRLPATRFKGVGDAQEGDEFSVHGGVDGGLARTGEPFGVGVQRTKLQAELPHKPPRPHGNVLPCNRSADAVAGDGLKIRSGGKLEPSTSRRRHDGRRQRMLGRHFGCRHKPQHLVFVTV